MDVFEAVERRISVRAFRPEPVPEETVRRLVTAAQRAASGGNLQPWHVYALAGDALEDLKARVAGRKPSRTEYDIYPRELTDPYRTRRFECGEDMYATVGIPREDKAGRLAQFGRNAELFGAPVGLFFCVHRDHGAPQWSDVGMYMQTFMLLAVELGLDTCAQEFWAQYHDVVADVLDLPPELMLFSGMALGYRDPDAPINALRTRRAPLEEFAELRGF
jgi:nitroreductase